MDGSRMTWGLDGEDREDGVELLKTDGRWIGKAIPLLRTYRGQTTILEDAGVM
jgi:hypothetical protein